MTQKIARGNSKKYQRNKAFVGGGLLVLCLSIGGGYLYFREKTTLPDTGRINNDVVQELNKLIELPNEEPQVVTIKDKTRLAKQDFFSKAENGDKIIIYKEAHKAYLFRLEEKKIINITTFNTTEISSEKNEDQVNE